MTLKLNDEEAQLLKGVLSDSIFRFHNPRLRIVAHAILQKLADARK